MKNNVRISLLTLLAISSANLMTISSTPKAPAPKAPATGQALSSAGKATSQALSNAGTAIYNAPGRAVEAMGGNSQFITGQKGSLASAGRATGQALSNAGTAIYNAPGRAVEAMGGNSQFITGSAGSLASAGRATGQALSNAAQATGQALSSAGTAAKTKAVEFSNQFKESLAAQKTAAAQRKAETSGTEGITLSEGPQTMYQRVSSSLSSAASTAYHTPGAIAGAMGYNPNIMTNARQSVSNKFTAKENTASNSSTAAASGAEAAPAAQQSWANRAAESGSNFLAASKNAMVNLSHGKLSTQAPGEIAAANNASSSSSQATAQAGSPQSTPVTQNWFTRKYNEWQNTKQAKATKEWENTGIEMTDASTWKSSNPSSLSTQSSAKSVELPDWVHENPTKTSQPKTATEKVEYTRDNPEWAQEPNHQTNKPATKGTENNPLEPAWTKPENDGIPQFRKISREHWSNPSLRISPNTTVYGW